MGIAPRPVAHNIESTRSLDGTLDGARIADGKYIKLGDVKGESIAGDGSGGIVVRTPRTLSKRDFLAR